MRMGLLMGCALQMLIFFTSARACIFCLSGQGHGSLNVLQKEL